MEDVQAKLEMMKQLMDEISSHMAKGMVSGRKGGLPMADLPSDGDDGKPVLAATKIEMKPDAEGSDADEASESPDEEKTEGMDKADLVKDMSKDGDSAMGKYGKPGMGGGSGELDPETLELLKKALAGG